MGRTLLFAIGAGLAAGLLYFGAVTGTAVGIFLALLSPLPIFLVGLALGPSPALIAGGAAVLATTLAAGPVLGAGMGLSIAGPAAILAALASYRVPHPTGPAFMPAGAVLTGLTLVGVALLLAGLAPVMTEAEGPERAVRAFVDRALFSFAGGTATPAAPPGWVLDYFPGIVVVSWLSILVVNGVLAQALLRRRGWNLRPSANIAGVTVPRMFDLFLVAALVTGLAVGGGIGYLGRNAAVVLGFPYVFAGLGAIHAATVGWRHRAFGLAFVYGMVVIYPKTFLALAAIGFADRWLGIRDRSGPANSENVE